MARRATEARRTLQEEVRLALIRLYRDPRVQGQQAWMQMQREKMLRGRVPRVHANMPGILRRLREQRDEQIMAEPAP